MPLSKVAIMCLETSMYIKADIMLSEKEIPVKKPQPRQLPALSSNFYSNYTRLRNNPNEFFEEMMMTVEVFDYILVNVVDELEAIQSVSWISTPEQKLYITLRYLAGMRLQKLASFLSISRSLAKKAIIYTMEAIVKKLSARHLRNPTHEEMKILAEEYYKKWRFPNCIGSIGGKYIRVVRRSHAPSGKPKKVILNAVVDANFRFLSVNVVRRRDSEFAFVQKMFAVSSMQYLPGTGILLPLVLIGNEAFPLKNNLMKPYSSKSAVLPEHKVLFNESLKQARVTVDCAFEILTERWKIFTKPMELPTLEIRMLVNATCLLHNIIKDIDGQRDPHISKFGKVDNGVIYLNLVHYKSRRNNRAPAMAVNIRDQISEYMWNMNENSVVSVPPELAPRALDMDSTA